jgi:hypothetical protein
MNLTIKCESTDIVTSSWNELKAEVFGIGNIDEIAEAIAEEADPAVLVTRKNKDGLLEAIGEDYVKFYFNLTESKEETP